MKKIKSLLKKCKFWMLALVGIGVLSNVFISTQNTDLMILSLTFLWILSAWLYNFEGRVSIAVALAFLAMCPFLLILKKESTAEKAAVWAYIFLSVGVAQQFIEYIRERR